MCLSIQRLLHFFGKSYPLLFLFLYILGLKIFLFLFVGDITRERTNKQKVLKDGTHITGLAFRTTAKLTYLFVATMNNVFLYNITAKDKEVKV